MGSVWIFVGEGKNVFPSGAYSTVETAEAWIEKHKLTGCLTSYPLDIGVYDWAIECGHWAPKHAYQREAKFIQQFSSAPLEHYHYEAGRRVA